MLGYESERRLRDLLMTISDGEREIEFSRQRLCNIRDFSPHAAFQRIGRDLTDFLTPLELLMFLNDNQVHHVSEQELQQLLRFFDSDEDGRLSYQDFLQIVLPCEDNVLRNIAAERPSHRVGRFDFLPRDIEQALAETLEREVDFQRRLEILKRELECRYDYTQLAAFRSIDKYNVGKIDMISLGVFLNSHDVNASEIQKLAIIRRIDTDGDACLDFNEFSEFMRTNAVQTSSVGNHIPGNIVAKQNYYSTGVSFIPERKSPLVPCTPPRNVIHEVVTLHPPFHIHNPFVDRQPSPSRKPILRVTDEDELINSLIQQCSFERELEAYKISLTNKSDFNLFDAFNIFDMGRVGVLTVHDIKEGLNLIGVYPTQEEVELFVTRYDRNHDRRLTFAEFSDAFLALDPYFSQVLNRRNANNSGKAFYKRDDCFLQDTQIEFRSMWRTHFKIECASETLRQRLQVRPFFNIYQAFNSLDINNDGRVTFDEVKRMIESRGFMVDKRELSSVMEKMDKNKDGAISYHEFREEMLPKSPNIRA